MNLAARVLSIIPAFEDQMSAFLLTPPATEPLTLAEAKQFLRIEHNDDDAVIRAGKFASSFAN